MANMYPSKKAGGGGGLSETLLWTNPTPSGSYSGGLVTLSEAVYDGNTIIYDYIKIELRNAGSSSYVTEVLYPTSVLKYMYSNAYYVPIGISDQGSNQMYVRYIQLTNATTLRFGSCYKTGTSSGYSSACYPLTVKGCKLT